MKSADTDRIVLRPDPKIKALFVERVREHMSDQNKVATALVGWWCRQDFMVRALVVGAVPPDPDVIALALKRMASERRRGKRRG